MYTDNSTNDKYPKTLVVRNSEGGMVWQIYHVEKEKEAEILARNATGNGFYAITLEDHQPELKQTWEDWRETEGGKKIINSK